MWYKNDPNSKPFSLFFNVKTKKYNALHSFWSTLTNGVSNPGKRQSLEINETLLFNYNCKCHFGSNVNICVRAVISDIWI